MSSIEEGLLYIVSTVGALLPIVNPLSAVGVVVSITQDQTEAERRAQIARACVYMFWILTAFLVAGGVIMNFFGISIPGLRIAGGLIVSYIGFRMLFPEASGISRQEQAEAVHKQDVSFTPLAMPMLSGPGSIGVIIGIASTAQDGEHVILNHALVAAGIAVTAAISYVVLRAAMRLNSLLGATGMNAIARLMGFLLVCIGVQFVINGIAEVVRSLPRNLM
jgi:multiple antibiotic resistance protein